MSLPYCIVFFLLAFLACSKIYNPTSPPLGETAIGYGTSFGECVGYCKTDLSIDSELATLTVSSWQPKKNPDKSTSERLPDDEWTALNI